MKLRWYQKKKYETEPMEYDEPYFIFWKKKVSFPSYVLPSPVLQVYNAKTKTWDDVPRVYEANEDKE